MKSWSHKVWAAIVAAVGLVIGLLALLLKSGKLARTADATMAARRAAEARAHDAALANAVSQAGMARSDQERLEAQKRAFEAKSAANEARDARDRLKAHIEVEMDDTERMQLFQARWKARAEKKGDPL